MSDYRTTPEHSEKMPRGIPYIISNEAAERFSFYGMSGILAVFLTTYFTAVGGKENFTPAQATVATSWFVTAAYLTPLLGAFIADTFFGKYKTIIRLSIVYCLGHACLALMGIAGAPKFWLIAGLGFVSLGAGGIKPCVSAHVGDQFGTSNQHLLTRIFNIFYFSINFGAVVSNLAIPIVLKYYGPHWAFGIPGVLMAIATVCFWMGRHKFIHVPPHGKHFITELKSPEGLAAIAKLIPLYLFVAIFWCLFDQTKNTLVFQAESMNRNVLGFEVLPSQIQAANPFLILVLIPLFTFVIYPLLEKRIKLTPLRKIGAGLFLMAVSFTVVSLSQVAIDKGGEPHIAWQLLAYLIFTSAEILISIVCLEFSYTQAPKKMKSFIMGLFLASVSLGSALTALVNTYIQLPKVELVEGIAHPGYDQKSNTADDLKLGDSVIESQVSGFLSESAGRVTKFYGDYRVTFDEIAASSKLPSAGAQLVAIGRLPDQTLHFRIFDASGQIAVDQHQGDLNFKEVHLKFEALKALLSSGPLANEKNVIDLTMEITGFSRSFPKKLANLPEDPWGNPLRYKYVHKGEVRILSDGPDAKEKTKWDLGVTITVKDIEKLGKNTWLYKEQKRRGLLEKTADKDAESGPLEIKYTAGGGLRLEQAPYFWFFTILMLITAVLFIPFALAFKSRTYLQDETAPNEDLTPTKP